MRVVIGAGDNGLVAAAMLADAGWSVAVLEAQAVAGGAVRTEELRHGPSNPDGRCVVLSTDVAGAAASLGSYAPGDGDGWRRLYPRWEELSPPLFGSGGDRAIGLAPLRPRSCPGAGPWPCARQTAPMSTRPRCSSSWSGVDHLPPRVLDWALSGPVPWTSEAARRAGTVHVTDSLDELSRYFTDLATGTVPSRPFLLFGQQAVADSRPAARRGRPPGGLHPRPEERGVQGRGGGGSADLVEARVADLAPGFRSLVQARHVLAPASFGAADSNLRGGAVSAGTQPRHQQFVFRPTPGPACSWPGLGPPGRRRPRVVRGERGPGCALLGPPAGGLVEIALGGSRVRVTSFVLGTEKVRSRLTLVPQNAGATGHGVPASERDPEPRAVPTVLQEVWDPAGPAEGRDPNGRSVDPTGTRRFASRKAT